MLIWSNAPKTALDLLVLRVHKQLYFLCTRNVLIWSNAPKTALDLLVLRVHKQCFFHFSIKAYFWDAQKNMYTLSTLNSSFNKGHSNILISQSNHFIVWLLKNTVSLRHLNHSFNLKFEHPKQILEPSKSMNYFD